MTPAPTLQILSLAVASPTISSSPHLWTVLGQSEGSGAHFLSYSGPGSFLLCCEVGTQPVWAEWMSPGM